MGGTGVDDGGVVAVGACVGGACVAVGTETVGTSMVGVNVGLGVRVGRTSATACGAGLAAGGSRDHDGE